MLTSENFLLDKLYNIYENHQQVKHHNHYSLYPETLFLPL